MNRGKLNETPFTSISCEGGLLPSDFLQQLIGRTSSLEGLSATAYHFHDEKLNEVINRSWIHLLQKWHHFKKSSQSGYGSAMKELWLFPLFDGLGYGRLLATRPLGNGEKKYAISHAWGHVPIHFVDAELSLDDHTYKVKGSSVRQSPHMLVQELLNRSDGHLWGIVTNGLRLRLLRRNKRLTHHTYIEFDLEAMMLGDMYADFSLFWLLCHQSRFEGEHPEDCWLERWSRLAHERSVRALDNLREGVEKAVRLLGQGFLEYRTNQRLRDRLRSGSLLAQTYYCQILRLIYRLIVLFVAEDRELLLVPDASTEAKDRYMKYYSMNRLRHLAMRYRGSRHTDIFHILRLIMQKVSQDGGCHELALPTLDGFLFEEDPAMDIDHCDISNTYLLEAVRSLTLIAQEDGLKSVDYQHIGSEELGSVYETLLEFQAVVEGEPLTFFLQVKPEYARKASGRYYTPRTLVEHLLDSALEPLLIEACQQFNSEEALLSLKVCDPACGSGHFLIAVAQRIAYRLASERSNHMEPDRETWHRALRDVVRHCIYGVDSNSMAVELCKVSLCIEAIEPGKPLVFLDYHIRHGDSLIGATPALLRYGIPESAFGPSENDVPQLSHEYRKRNREGLAGQWHLLVEPMDIIVDQLELLQTWSDSSYKDIQDIKKRHRELAERQEYQNNTLIANAWCAAFLWPKTYIPSSSLAYPLTQGILRELIENRRAYSETLVAVQRLAQQHHFFHWHLAFPEVFKVPENGRNPENEHMGWSGGFDVVLGNPPYISGENRDQRVKAFLQTVFSLAKGQYDIYWLFIEQGLHLINTKGRLAFVVPDTLLARDETQRTRELLLHGGLEHITYCGAAFKAEVSTITFVARNGSNTSDILSEMLNGTPTQVVHRHNKERFLSDSRYRFLIHIADEEASIFSRIENACPTLKDFVKISRGEEIGKKGVSSQGPFPILVGEDISRYFMKQPSRFLHIIQKDISYYQSPKIVITKTGSRCIAALDTSGYATMQSVYNVHIIRLDMTYKTLLALLNSRFVRCFIYKTFTSYKTLFPQLNQSTVLAVPVPPAIQDAEKDLLQLVEGMQHFSSELKMAKKTQMEDVLRSEMSSVDQKIDQIIYDLYGLTVEEVRLIERGVIEEMSSASPLNQ